MKHKAGFTLIELLVVIAIIGLLATMAVVSFGNAQVKARDAKRLSDLKNLRMAVMLYYDDNGAYPCGTGSEFSIDDQTTCLTGALVPTYLGSIPLDPKYGNDGTVNGNDYRYTSNGTTYYRIRSYLEGSPLKQNSKYPNGTTCQSGSYPICSWTGQDCVYILGASCERFMIQLSQ